MKASCFFLSHMKELFTQVGLSYPILKQDVFSLGRLPGLRPLQPVLHAVRGVALPAGPLVRVAGQRCSGAQFARGGRPALRPARGGLAHEEAGQVGQVNRDRNAQENVKMGRVSSEGINT